MTGLLLIFRLKKSQKTKESNEKNLPISQIIQELFSEKVNFALSEEKQYIARKKIL